MLCNNTIPYVTSDYTHCVINCDNEPGLNERNNFK